MMSRKRGNLSISVKRLFEAGGVWPVVVVENDTGRVISLSETNEAAFRTTLRTGRCHYWDSVNRVVYLKGEHSDEVETLREVRLDICHARRHRRYLLYRVDLAPGRCKFGMSRCQFYAFDGKGFVLDRTCVTDPAAVLENWERVNTLLDEREERVHMERFKKSRGKAAAPPADRTRSRTCAKPRRGARSRS